MAPKPSLFRQESLERLSSPERLDQLMQVVAPKDWLGLVVLGSLALGALGWSIWGRIPVTVNAKGVLIYPYRVAEIQAPTAGRLQGLSVKVGDPVHKGDILGVVDQAVLQEELRQQQQKLKQLLSQDQELETMTAQRVNLDLSKLQQERQAIAQRLQAAQDVDPRLYQQQLQTLQAQRQNLQQQLQTVQQLEPVLRERFTSRQQLQRDGAISADTVLEAEQAYRTNLNQGAELQAQLQDLSRQEVAAEQTLQTSASQVADLQTQLRDLDRQVAIASQQDQESANTRKNQIQEVRQQIAQLTQQLQTNQPITSPYDGRVVEVAVQPGQVLTQGTKVVTIESTNASPQLLALNYFPIKDGKQIAPGMTVQITPDTVKREEFGGILGVVRSTSAFPVTRQGIVSAVGNPELADSLVVAGGQIEVVAELQLDGNTTSGYRWSSSRGPNLKLSPGTPTSVRITLREEAPLSFVLPFLRQATGLN